MASSGMPFPNAASALVKLKFIGRKNSGKPEGMGGRVTLPVAGVFTGMAGWAADTTTGAAALTGLGCAAETTGVSGITAP